MQTAFLLPLENLPQKFPLGLLDFSAVFAPHKITFNFELDT